MSNGLVERLRRGTAGTLDDDRTMDAAADEIEQLLALNRTLNEIADAQRAEIERLRDELDGARFDRAIRDRLQQERDAAYNDAQKAEADRYVAEQRILAAEALIRTLVAELGSDDEPVEGELEDVVTNIKPVDTPLMRRLKE